MQCKWQVEINPFCRKVLAKHWPDVRRHDDVRTFPPDESGDWRVDVVCGGFPCQDISHAGNGGGSLAKEADCSTKQCESFARWDRDSSSWKTSQRCLIAEWATFSGRWPRAGSMQSGNVYRRHPLARSTTETGFSFVPTARAQYRGCSQNRVESGEHRSNIEDWLVIRLAENGPVRGLKVNLTWLSWLMGFPIGWGEMESERDLETPSSPKSPSGLADES